MPPSGADAGQATAHWFQVDTTNLGSLTLADQGNVGGNDVDAGAFTYFPSIAVDLEGDLAIGFALSSPNHYPGAYYAGRLATDAAGTVRSTHTLAAGVADYLRTFGGPSNRWGDYSGMALDPSNEVTFWVFNQYSLTPGTPLNGEDGRWGTRWGSFSLLEPPSPPLNVTASAIQGGATVSWDLPASDGGTDITHYAATSDPDGLTATTDEPIQSTEVIGLTVGTPYTFTVTATNIAGTSDPSAPSNPATPTPRIADLSIINVASPDPLNRLRPLTYTVTVTSNGPDTAAAVVLTDTLPDSISFTSATPTQGSCQEADKVVTCALGILADGATVIVDIVGAPQEEGLIENIATVATSDSDPDEENNTAAAQTTVNPAPTPVPGLSRWGMTATAVLLAGVLFFSLRRRWANGEGT